jgi:hypothetical protein
MARKDGDLIKPSIYSFFANALVGFVFAIPLVIAAIIFGGDDNFIGRGILFGLGALMLFAQYTVTYIFSGMTVYLIYGFLSEGDGQMDKAWAVIRRDLFDIMSLAAASALVKIVENTLRGNNRRGGRGRNPIGGIVANILDTVWTTATYFVLPAMIIEDLNLWNALKRATHLIKNNLLLVGVGFVGVGIINNILGGGLVLLAILIAVGIAFGLSALGTFGVVAGIVIGVGLVIVVAGIVNVFTSYVSTAYHTSLFIWARGNEKAQATSLLAGTSAASVSAPAPLAAVLGSIS